MCETPQVPTRTPPPADWPHRELLSDVKDALHSLPFYFQTETVIEGISATDIFTLNSALGATIENQVVDTLNHMRSVWDPDERYALYSFVRQSQTFPDVLLRRSPGAGPAEDDILLGIELKGWYLLAKEQEPSFRFQVTPGACACQDLLVVVPWVLNRVISGSPRVLPPYIEYSRYAAEYRNHHWRFMRSTKGNRDIQTPPNVCPYPAKMDHIADAPADDRGGNFGRFARTGLMDSYLQRTRAEELCGISAEYWLRFFKIFQDQSDATRVRQEVERLRGKLQSRQTDERLSALLEILEQTDRLAEM